jgi:glycosyltransferase involved in cell wall biosynthesis
VVLEAMAQARPILVSDVGATAELVDMHNGYLLPPGDADALYAAILAFSERPSDVRAKMGVYSHARVKERFSWPVVARAHADLCKRVAAIKA